MKYLRLDSQILSSFSQCQLRCKFAFIDRLEPKEEKSALSKGSVVHEGLKSYYNDLKNRITFEERVSNALLSANTFAVTKTELNQEDIELCMRTLNEYMKYRKDDRVEVIAVEQGFSKTLYEGKDLFGEDITILYETLIDLVVTESDSFTYVYDHKTSSRTSTLNPVTVQFLGYAWLTGLRIVHNSIGFQTSLELSKKFKKTYFAYDPILIANWEEYAIRKALEYAYCLDTNKFMPNFSACDGKFGYPCNYINVCKWPDLAEKTKELEFKIGKLWDPLSKEGE